MHAGGRQEIKERKCKLMDHQAEHPVPDCVFVCLLHPLLVSLSLCFNRPLLLFSLGRRRRRRRKETAGGGGGG